MSFLNKLERKFGRYAIRNLSLYLIIGYIIGYVFDMMGILAFFTLNPTLILKGQIWRLLTWIITPPDGLSIFTVIMLYFYYSIGTDLERTWGTFRYNLYIFSGMLFTAVGTMLLYALSVWMGLNIYINGISTYYLCLSIFLAFAIEYPNMEIWLMMVIPVKVKWLAYVDAAYLIYMLAMSSWVRRMMIICSLLNFLVLFFATRNYKRISPTELRRKRNYRQQIRRAQDMSVHKCHICGQTSESNPELQFRYCSKCNGNYEYCQNHLFTHKHVQ